MTNGRILLMTTLIATVVVAPCPEVCRCPSRYHADCDHASLVDIPQNLSDQVRFLNVSSNNFRIIRRNTFSSSNVRHIKILDLSDNEISTIDRDGLWKLEGLIFLYLSRNDISSLDQFVFNMNTRLEFLKLDGNMLRLPSEKPFLNIPSLKSFDLSFCNIRSFPVVTFVKLSNLEELVLSYNKIQSIDPKVFLPLDSLKSLYISHNMLKSLEPTLFMSLKSLEILDLSKNQIQTLHPELFTYLKQMEHLDLSGNRLRTLDFKLFAKLTRLKKLHLHRNLLNSINEEHFKELSNLSILDLSGNHLDDFEFRIMCHLNNLTYLKVSENRLACDCALWELWKWSRENRIQILSTCNEPDFEFSNKNFEQLGANNSCNATSCDLQVLKEVPQDVASPIFVYLITGFGLLLVLIACVVTSFVVFRYRKEFCKRKNIDVPVRDTITYVSSHHEDYLSRLRQQELQEELHRQHQQTLLRNRLQKELSDTLSLPRSEHRHSYHECRLPSEDGRQWFNADTLPAENRTSVYLSSVSSRPDSRTPRKRPLSEHKPKGYPKSATDFVQAESFRELDPESTTTLTGQAEVECLPSSSETLMQNRSVLPTAV